MLRWWRHGAVAFLAVLGLVLLASSDVLHAWFGADDFLWLEIGTMESVSRSFVGGWGHGAAWRPLSRLSFYLDLKLFGLDAWGWHLDSLLWHAAGTTLLAILLDRVTGERKVAIVAAAIFALFPMHHETSMWISGRSHPMAFTACMASLLVLTRFLDSSRPRQLALCAALLAAALLSYEAAVYTLPFAMLVVLGRGNVERRSALLGIGTIALVTALYLVLRRWVLSGESLYPVAPIRSYLTLAFVEKLGEVARQLLAQIAPSPWWFALTALLTCWVAPRLMAIAGVGLLVIAIGYAPFAVVPGFGPRFAYASLAGLAIVLAAIVVGLSRVRWIGKPAAALLLAVLLVHELRETQQIAVEWRMAGDVGRRALDRLVHVWHDPDPDRPAVILGAPPTIGRAFVFFTYFDLALGVFHPEYAGFRVPGHVLSDFSPATSRALLAGTWQREQERRKERGLAPLVCPGVHSRRARDLDGFLRVLLECDAVFYAIDRRDLTVRRLPRAFVEARLKRGWQTPL